MSEIADDVGLYSSMNEFWLLWNVAGRICEIRSFGTVTDIVSMLGLLLESLTVSVTV